MSGEQQHYPEQYGTEHGLNASPYSTVEPALQFSGYAPAFFPPDPVYLDSTQFAETFENHAYASQAVGGASDLTLGADIAALTKPNHDVPWTGTFYPQVSYDGDWTQYGQETNTSSSPLEPHRPILRADSGYESQLARQGHAPRAIALKRETSAQDHKRRLSRASSVHGTSEVSSQVGNTPGKRRAVAALPPCSVCGKPPLHKSDQTKHAKTHSRPYKCSVDGCPDQIKGFGTINDKDRHEMSKHDIYKPGHVYYGYVCPACPQSSTGKDKWWPRADNFKSHVKRKHPNLNLELTMSTAKRQKQPDDNMTVITGYNTTYAGHSVADTDLQYQQQEEPLGATPFGSLDLGDPSLPDLAQWLQPGGSDPIHDAGVGVGALFDDANPLLPQDYGTQGSDMLAGSFSDHKISVDQALHERAASGLVSDYDDIKMEHVKSGHEGHNLYLPASGNKRRRVDESGKHSQQLEDATPRHCEHCGKSGENLRPCDMRKHISRHHRRYGCTEPRCYDKHGSKSDWYRHEDRLHRLPAAYLCRIPDAQGQFCNEYCRSEQTYRQHLATSHNYTDGKDIAQKVEEMALPKEGRHRFWCGFCQDVVPNPDTRDPWNARCIHIGKHMDLSGGKSILEWICPELQKPKGQVTEEDKKLPKTKHMFPQPSPR